MENRGLDPVPDDERTGRVRTLFPTWVTANMTVLLLTVGAGLTVFAGLNFWQVLFVAVAAPVVSFGLVGLVSIAGKRGGAPGMALSRAVFGQRGNLFPGALLWVVRWGWETVNAVTGSYALLAVLDLALRHPAYPHADPGDADGLRRGELPRVGARVQGTAPVLPDLRPALRGREPARPGPSDRLGPVAYGP